MLEERLLVFRFNRGDRTVLRRIYEKYKDDLVTLAAALSNDKTTAEDAVHDAFVAFIRSTGSLRLTGSLKGYLARCVVNNVRNRFRTAQRQHNIALDQIGPVPSGSNGPEVAAILAEDTARLSSALTRLPYEQREVIILHLHSRMKFKAIAKLQEVSINTVQGRYRYGLDKLRSMLNGEMRK